MDLKAQSHILGRHFVTKIALNHPYQLLAAAIDSSDTLAFFRLLPNSPPEEVFQGMSKPSGKKSALAWSNDGNHLALGSSNLELWRFDGKKMVPLKTFSEDFVDVKIVAWSPDSISVAYGGLSRKNVIKVKNIESGATRDLKVPLALCSISYDPFGKYLLVLLRNNTLYVYNSSHFVKIREICLSPKGDPHGNVNTVK
jgi:WD40 repeat protein